MAIRTYGMNGVDWEQRIDYDRLRTERLARLSKVELGPIVAVREIFVPGDVVPNQDDFYRPQTEDGRPRKRLETSRYQEIPVRVELMVRFDVHTKAEGKGPSEKR